MSGFTPIPNEDFSGWIYSNPLYFRAWCTLYNSANYKDGYFDFKGTPIELKRGELVLSIRNFAEKTGLSTQCLRTFLKKLIKTKKICAKTDQNLTHITICNYDSYKGDQHSTNTVLTQLQHSTNTVLTQDQHYPNTITTNKQKQTTKQYHNDSLNLIPENSQNEFQDAPETDLNLIESKPTKPKPTKEPKPKKEPKITEGTKEIVEQWYKQNNKTLYYTGKEAKAMVLICAKISNLINVNGKECNDNTIRDSLRLLLENVAKIDTWIYDNFNLSLFASKIETLADKMKNGQTAAPKFVSKDDERKAHNAELQRKILQKIATHIAENPNNPVH